MIDRISARPAMDAPSLHFHKGHAFGFAALLVVATQAYSWPVVTPIMVLAAIGVLVANRGRLARPPLILIGILGAAAIYGAVGASWAISGKLALKTAWTLVGTAVPGVILISEARKLDERERAWFELCLLAGYLLGLANMELQFLTHGEIIGWLKQLDIVQAVFGRPSPISMVMFDTQMTLIGLLIWPTFAIASRRFGVFLAALIAAAGLAVVAQGLSGTAKFAYVIGFVVLACASVLPRATAAIVGAALAIWLAFAPILQRSATMEWAVNLASHVSPRLTNSLSHRAAIWDFAITRIHDHPLLGWGLGSSRLIPGGHETISYGLELMPLHPHSAALQLRLELGIPGVVLGLALVVWVWFAISRLAARRLEHGLALALLAAVALNAASSYNLWHTWWMTFMWIASAFATAVFTPKDNISGQGAQPQGGGARVRPD